MPSPRHLHILAVGFLLGAFLSPACMGRLNPAAYDRVFVGSGDQTPLALAQKNLADYLQKQPIADAAQVAQLRHSGVTPVAADELQADLTETFGKGVADRKAACQRAEDEITLARAIRRKHLTRLSTGLVLLMLACMALEPLWAAKSALRRHAPLLRYGAGAAWIALHIAVAAVF